MGTNNFRGTLKYDDADDDPDNDIDMFLVACT